MKNRSDLENFWTRGDIHTRIHKAMSEAGLNDRKLEIEDLSISNFSAIKYSVSNSSSSISPSIADINTESLKASLPALCDMSFSADSNEGGCFKYCLICFLIEGGNIAVPILDSN